MDIIHTKMFWEALVVMIMMIIIFQVQLPATNHLLMKNEGFEGKLEGIGTFITTI